jgi:hypothetical protein
VLHDGDQVKLGGTVLTAHLTAGHTKGCTKFFYFGVDPLKQNTSAISFFEGNGFRQEFQMGYFNNDPREFSL